MSSDDYRIGRLNGKWVVTWWQDGKRHRYRLNASTRQEAEREKAGFVAGVKQRETNTVATLWDAYCREKAGRRVVAAMGFEWKVLGPFFGHLEPGHITIDLCRQYVAKRRASGKKGATADGTIWTELGHLRTVLLWAEASGLIERAPRIERPSKPKPRERHLTHAEADKLVAAAKMPHIRLAIIIMLTTAARVGAVTDLTWDRVDLARRTIRLALPDAVTRKGRATVPINSALLAELEDAKAGAQTDHVIEWNGEPVASIRKGFEAAVKAAGLTDVTPHVIRHTAAVWMAETGIDMEQIAQYMGHDDSRVTRRVYARFSPDHLQKAAAALEITLPPPLKKGKAQVR